MALRDQVDEIVKYVKSKGPLIEHNNQLFDIFEGLLLDYLIKDLKEQLSRSSFKAMEHRIAPINLLKRVIDKLSKIYNKAPLRWLEIESENDQELLNYYMKSMGVDESGMTFNELFNLFKNSAWEPFVKNGKPALRVIPSNRFLVYSTDKVDPTEPTHFIKLMGTENIIVNSQEKKVNVLYIYTADEFLPVGYDGNDVFVLDSVLNENENPEGINPYGVLPFVYINQSKHTLISPIDTDTLRMTKIFPIILSDMNFAVMFQAFSIVYGIDVDDENIQMSPNAFWRLKSDPTTKTKPEIGTIKPQVDITQVVGFIASQLGLWLQSKNIRPGQIGDASGDQFASGVSKVVDEMDTWEARQKQVPVFQKAEEKLWDLIINHTHPYWVQNKMIDEKRSFLPNQFVHVEFPEQKPMTKRIEIINEVKEELQLGLTTKKEAMMRLNPEMAEDTVDDLIKQIELDRTVVIEETSEAMNGEQMDEDNS